MANQWNSKHAIWRDLSVAQGRAVPAQIDHTVAQDERPPRLTFSEETEEQFFSNYAGGGTGDYSSGPDLELIQKMLQEVSRPTEEECPGISNGDTNIVISKKPVKQKNLAIASLIEMRDNRSDLKYQNFVAMPNSSQPVFSTDSMFKKKVKNSSEKSTPSPTPVKPEAGSESEPRKFVPSQRAALYYNKYCEHNEAEQTNSGDIWSLVQRQLREMDKRKKLPGADLSRSGAEGMDLVRLSTHRHTFTRVKECIVCQRIRMFLCNKKEETPVVEDNSFLCKKKAETPVVEDNSFFSKKKEETPVVEDNSFLCKKKEETPVVEDNSFLCKKKEETPVVEDNSFLCKKKEETPVVEDNSFLCKKKEETPVVEDNSFLCKKKEETPVVEDNSFLCKKKEETPVVEDNSVLDKL